MAANPRPTEIRYAVRGHPQRCRISLRRQELASLIPSESMEPTLQGCTGDRIVVDKVSYRFGDSQPGDVVVFKGPASWSEDYQSKRSSNVIIRGAENLGSLVDLVPPGENDLVKRVIAVGGQKVQCLPDDPAVMVDGKPLSESYIDRTMPESNSACQGRFFGPVTIPEDNVWVMGDNRANSNGSRFHLDDERQVTVPVSDIIGKVPLHRSAAIAVGCRRCRGPAVVPVACATRPPFRQAQTAETRHFQPPEPCHFSLKICSAVEPSRSPKFRSGGKTFP